MTSRSKRRTGSTRRELTHEEVARRLVALLQGLTPQREDAFIVLVGVAIALCAVDEQPITTAQELGEDIRRGVTELVMGDVEEDGDE